MTEMWRWMEAGPSEARATSRPGVGPEGETEVGSGWLSMRCLSNTRGGTMWPGRRPSHDPARQASTLAQVKNSRPEVAKGSAPTHEAGQGQGVFNPAVPARSLPLPLALWQLRIYANLGKQPKGKKKTIVQNDRLLSSH